MTTAQTQGSNGLFSSTSIKVKLRAAFIILMVAFVGFGAYTLKQMGFLDFLVNDMKTNWVPGLALQMMFKRKFTQLDWICTGAHRH